MAKRKQTKRTAKKVAKKKTQPSSAANSTKKRTRISQSDVPAHSLEDAIRIPKAIADNYGKAPTRPLKVAQALDMSPTSSTFKMITGAAIAYGLTEGGYNAGEISISELGKRIVAPLEIGDDIKAKREALMKPRVMREFLDKYDGSPLPPQHIIENVLEDMGVPTDRTKAVSENIISNAKYAGLIATVKNKEYIDLHGASPASILPESAEDENIDLVDELSEEDDESTSIDEQSNSSANPTPKQQDDRLRRVFVAHGKNRKLIPAVKKLLEFGEMTPVLAVERQTVAQPIPEKVMSDMRSCGASIIHVDDEKVLLDKDEVSEVIVLNPNVLIEIGASMALYGKRFVLLVKSGVKLPSNLQGLSEVRYEGDDLSGDSTIRLLEAIRDIKNHSLPE